MIAVRTPCRLHFGLLAYGPGQQRQFGGVGLMIHSPDIEVQVQPAGRFTATGPLARQAETFARCFAQRAAQRGLVQPITGAQIRVVRAPRPHSGLGSGTQLAMAVGDAMARLTGCCDLCPAQLASLVGRGLRSAVGAHGFFSGGFIVEGGKSRQDDLSPKLMHLAFPDQWRIVLVTPERLAGICGQREREAFWNMQPIDPVCTADMCRLVLLGMAPALVEQDLTAFGQALYHLQIRAGECFQQVQGGIYADPVLARIVTYMRSCGIDGVGQSSWGPTLYAICHASEAAALQAAVKRQFALTDEEVITTCADNRGRTRCDDIHHRSGRTGR